MSHQEVIQKKRDRLHKYTGAKLRRKTAALERALAKFDSKPTLKSSPKADSTEPEWDIVLTSGKSVRVNASSQKKAREKARDVLGLPRLPAGTTATRV